MTLPCWQPDRESPPADPYLAQGERRGEEIREVARFMDDRLEWLPYESATMDQVRRELAEMAADGFLNLDAIRALTEMQLVLPEQIREEARRLPVFPAALYKAIRTANDPEASARELEQVLSGDPVLAGSLIEVANSPLYPRVQLSRSVRDAIVYLGLEATRRILAAAALRPLVASSGVQELWKHALCTADAAESLARLHGGVDPLAAFLAGLVHDIGRLVFERMPAPVVELYRRFSECGCPLAWTEKILFGMDHGEAGALVLEHWNFPADIRDAVRCHHEPERTESAFTCLLHLAEEHAGVEAIPSGVRIDFALDISGLDPDRAQLARALRSPLLERLSAA
jgi:putative nucleotidyltransferase with HDIG domain